MGAETEKGLPTNLELTQRLCVDCYGLVDPVLEERTQMQEALRQIAQRRCRFWFEYSVGEIRHQCDCASCVAKRALGQEGSGDDYR